MVNHRSGDRQNDWHRDLMNRIKEREGWLRILDDIAAAWTCRGPIGDLSSAFSAFDQRHKSGELRETEIKGRLVYGETRQFRALPAIWDREKVPRGYASRSAVSQQSKR